METESSAEHAGRENAGGTGLVQAAQGQSRHGISHHARERALTAPYVLCLNTRVGMRGDTSLIISLFASRVAGANIHLMPASADRGRRGRFSEFTEGHPVLHLIT